MLLTRHKPDRTILNFLLINARMQPRKIRCPLVANTTKPLKKNRLRVIAQCG